jgi:hypothetical protein
MHSSSHAPDPDSLQEQSFVQSERTHRLLFSQLMVHPLPAHDRSTDPDPSEVTLQPPWGHENVQGPLPSQRNSQPAPGQVSVQGSEVTHWQIWPGVQLVEFVVAVVATHATSAEAITTKPSERSIHRPALPVGRVRGGESEAMTLPLHDPRHQAPCGPQHEIRVSAAGEV